MTFGEKHRNFEPADYNLIMPSLSIVIPAYNEEALLAKTLQRLQVALSEAGITDAEVIVSDDASTDRTAQIAGENGAKVVSTNNRQIAATRNAGAAAATSERLLFLDADTVLPAGTLKAAVRELDAGAVGCGVSIRFDKKPNIFIRLMSWSILAPMRLLGYAAGCCIFVTREAFDAVGGFPEEFYASEELWFCRAIKQEGRFVLLREPVITSARKMDYHSTPRIFWMMIKVAVGGTEGLKTRKNLDLWYDGQRG